MKESIGQQKFKTHRMEGLPSRSGGEQSFSMLELDRSVLATWLQGTGSGGKIPQKEIIRRLSLASAHEASHSFDAARYLELEEKGLLPKGPGGRSAFGPELPAIRAALKQERPKTKYSGLPGHSDVRAHFPFRPWDHGAGYASSQLLQSIGQGGASKSKEFLRWFNDTDNKAATSIKSRIKGYTDSSMYDTSLMSAQHIQEVTADLGAMMLLQMSKAEMGPHSRELIKRASDGFMNPKTAQLEMKRRGGFIPNFSDVKEGYSPGYPINNINELIEMMNEFPGRYDPSEEIPKFRKMQKRGKHTDILSEPTYENFAQANSKKAIGMKNEEHISQ